MSARPDPARIAQLHQLLAEGGRSRAQIGKLMGCSKNAVTGLVRRHVFGKANGYRNPAKADKPRKVYSRKRKPVVVARPDPPRNPSPPLPAMKLEPCGACQWPTTNGQPWRFCEAPVARPGSPWCARHRAVVYVRCAA